MADEKLQSLLNFRSWKNKDLLTKFMQKDYDEKLFISNKILLNSQEMILNLSELMNEISDEIRKQVITHHQDLLLQTSHVVNIESQLKTSLLRLKTLSDKIQHIKKNCIEPYHHLKRYNIQLKHIQQSIQALTLIAEVFKLNTIITNNLNQYKVDHKNIHY